MRFTIKKILATAAVPATAVGILALGSGAANASTTHSAANTSSALHSGPSGNCNRWNDWNCRHHGNNNRNDHRYHNDRNDHRNRNDRNDHGNRY